MKRLLVLAMLAGRMCHGQTGAAAARKERIHRQQLSRHGGLLPESGTDLWWQL